MLSLEQEKILNASENYQLIIAGAGCGKTYTLIKKIEMMITQGMTNILVISFTNMACTEIKERLKRSEIEILTFHKLAKKILKHANHEHTYTDGYDSFFKWVEDNYYSEYVQKVMMCMLEDTKEVLRLISSSCITIFKLSYYKEIDLCSWKTKLPIYLLNYVSDTFHINANTPRHIIYEYIANKHSQQVLTEKIMKCDNVLKLYDKLISFLEKTEVNELAQYKNQDYYLYDLFVFMKNKYTLYMTQMREYSFHFLLVQAIEQLDTCNLKFDVIMVDEFQDINTTCLQLLRKLVLKMDAKLICVGDDWQSIYGFAGSVPNSMNQFEDNFRGFKTYYLCRTFRYSLNLADISSAFVQQDKQLIKKQMTSQITLPNPIDIVLYTNFHTTMVALLDQYSLQGNLFILVRYKRQLKRVQSLIVNRANITCLTIHKAKGLEADNVIVLMDDELGLAFNDYKYKRNLDSYFVTSDDEFQYNEERRLFYVAITRTRNKVVLVNKKGTIHPFVQEIKQYF